MHLIAFSNFFGTSYDLDFGIHADYCKTPSGIQANYTSLLRHPRHTCGQASAVSVLLLVSPHMRISCFSCFYFVLFSLCLSRSRKGTSSSLFYD